MSKRPLKLTPGERLFVVRRRKNETQEQAAACHELSRMQYQRAEADEVPHLRAPEVGSLQPHELCVLYRRRSGLLQWEVAERAGMSRQWLIKVEAGEASAEGLLAFWADHERATARRRRSG